MSASQPARRAKAAAASLASLGEALLERPLRWLEAAALGAALVVAGTLYCLLYCAVAYPMHGYSMPPAYSASWAVFTFLPWLAALEAWKRAFPVCTSTGRVVAAGAGAATGAVTASLLIERIADLLFAVETRPWSFQAADQLPVMLATAAVAGIGYRRMKKAGTQVREASLGANGDGQLLPPPHQIDWIRAAGNYVEIGSLGRVLIRRLTMREAERLLDSDRFLRIHRSAIVNRDRIDQIGPDRRIRMQDGTALRAGHAYRWQLDRLRS